MDSRHEDLRFGEDASAAFIVSSDDHERTDSADSTRSARRASLGPPIDFSGLTFMEKRKSRGAPNERQKYGKSFSLVVAVDVDVDETRIRVCLERAELCSLPEPSSGCSEPEMLDFCTHKQLVKFSTSGLTENSAVDLLLAKNLISFRFRVQLVATRTG